MTETKKYYTMHNHIDHRTFGGIISFSDFNTYGRVENKNGSSIASQICNDRKFDNWCDKKSKESKEYFERGKKIWL